MTDSRRQRALTAARIRMRSPAPRPLLSEERIDEVCAELLALKREVALFRDVSGGAVRRHVDRVLEEEAAKSPPRPLPATIDTTGGSGHG